MTSSEHLKPEPRDLLPVTSRLIAETEALTGKGIEIKYDANISARGRAIYVVSDPDRSRDLVLIDPEHRRFKDALVAHEIGHIRHFNEIPSIERKIPVVGRKNRINAYDLLVTDLMRFKGIPDEELHRIASIWISGTVAQLSDTPSDIRIERWIWDTQPDLRDNQKASLRNQARTLAKVLDPRVAAVTPDPVWISSNAMNYTLVKSVAELLDDPSLVRPFRGTVIEVLGEDLLTMVDVSPEASLTTDRNTTNAWAQRLGFLNWFEWKRIDQLPITSMSAIE